MVVRRPVVLVSGALAELPFGDSIITSASGGLLTAGSGLSWRWKHRLQLFVLDVAFTAEPSGLIYVGNENAELTVLRLSRSTRLLLLRVMLHLADSSYCSGIRKCCALAEAEVALSSGNAGLNRSCNCYCFW